jgi:hypothetical protein
MTTSKQEKMDRMMEAFESLSDDAFEKWLDDQPEEDSGLFYELMFPDTGNDKNARSQPIKSKR